MLLWFMARKTALVWCLLRAVVALLLFTWGVLQLGGGSPSSASASSGSSSSAAASASSSVSAAALPPQCLQPLNCNQSAGAPLGLGACSSACAAWQYDTFTYFTFSSLQSGLLLTSAGPGGANATIDAGRSPSQQFAYNPTVMVIAPVSAQNLCLTAQ